MNPTDDELRAWLGRSETVHDTIGPTPVVALTATLDHPPAAVSAGMPLPPLWHWLYFLPMRRQREIGPDGHARRGGFLPPVPLPRRMWAGSQFEFRSAVRVGDTVARTSTIDDMTAKEGRSGKLVFVKVRHELRCNGASDPAIVEFHDIVYREAQRAGDVAPPPQRPPEGAPWQREIVPDDVLLFRYSALTFNGHRIHYDRRYVSEVEGYDGLIVHGPLMATLLAGLGAQHFGGREAKSFSFRALKPVIDLQPFDVCGAPQGGDAVELWIRDFEGHRAMAARMEFRT